MDLIKYGHFIDCNSNKVVEVIRSGDSNDIDVFGKCNCKELKKKYLKQIKNFKPKK